MKYLISGGGTGGHIFPAVSIANALRERDPQCEILFIGAKGRMEMKRVPDAGYEIVGLNVEGFDRKNMLRNVKVVWDLGLSMVKVRRIIRKFRPDVAIGVGGYASGAAMKVAEQMGIPVLVQEQNSFAGVTNKMLAAKASKICVAYEGMERFFPKDKIVITGNPVRQNLFSADIDREEAFNYFGLKAGVPTLLVIGGSLGARTINEAMIAGVERLKNAGVQVIWQTGSYYYEHCLQSTGTVPNDRSTGTVPSDRNQSPGTVPSDRRSVPSDRNDIKITEFVKRMDYAYAVADLVISRAGASSISELCLLGKASILVPSPNVAEDHQTHNARALSDKGAAILITDAEAGEKLIDTAITLLSDDAKLKSLSTEVLKLALPDSANKIADEVEKLAKKK